MEYKDYYQILGVSRDADKDDIRKAYRKLAHKYHPDVSSEPDAESKFQELQEAYEVLKDPEKRAAYDQVGQGYQQGQDFRPPPDWEQHFDFGGGGFTRGDASAFSDFFESLFGGAGGFFRVRSVFLDHLVHFRDSGIYLFDPLGLLLSSGGVFLDQSIDLGHAFMDAVQPI